MQYPRDPLHREVAEWKQFLACYGVIIAWSALAIPVMLLAYFTVGWACRFLGSLVG